MDTVQYEDGTVIEIIMQRWNRDTPSAPDDPSKAALAHRVFIDGREVTGALNARVLTSGSDFTTVMLRIAPGRLIVRDVDSEEWESYDGALGQLP